MKEIQILRNKIQIFRNEIQAGRNKFQLRRNEIKIQDPSIWPTRAFSMTYADPTSVSGVKRRGKGDAVKAMMR